MTGLITILDLGLAFAGYIIIRKLCGRNASSPLPPGPKKLPLLGNLFDMPNHKEWLTFAAWGEKWGDLVSVSVFGQHMVIVNSAQLAMEMLDKKGSIYSDRPVIQMGGEMVGWRNTLVLLPYGERFRSYRKLFHQLIGSNASMSQFYPVEEAETHAFLKRLLSMPQDLAGHVRRTAGAIILRISHGYEVKEGIDPFVKLADLATEQFSLSTTPGGFLVNLVPALNRLPDWFPGTGFKETAREWANTLDNMIEQPYQYVKDQLSLGTAELSFTARLLEEPGLTPEKEFDIKWTAGSLYSGGADTTVSAIYAFFKAMALHPEVVATVQAEIDSVVGPDRLPSFADRNDLPFVNALVLEVLRWHSVTPTGIPHVVTEDNIHDGYLIPKGSLIIANVWKMLHDPRMYSDPMKFNPERFLGPNPEPDPRQVCFGFGRRICPGRVLADASIFITCAMTLAVFDISKYMEDGKFVEPVVDQTTGTISHPTAFQCSIKPRSHKALALINAEL
ncbi:cytochrome P450 [Macrolepiota fuliginosa MF-IS2]|uniref:Cytochrome P450 n=1 Tax=Macrolepiota fuliginosa MF-IS2 TaxID=1400762 RepID=A0A9P5XMB0_9AGAR|nr:cytochrome P450 [Macrolepiota fuliginosa MF-IS2]